VSGRALVLGATSGIGRALAAALAARGHDLVLAGRRRDELARCAADLEIRTGVRAECRVFDALDFASHAELLRSCAEGGLQGVALCHGAQFEQEEAQRDFSLARRMIDVNYSSAVSLLEPAAAHLEAQRAGWICALSSVAGDRGRPSNYLYGSTKAALSAYLQGLQARLARSGVRVLIVKPGFVDTRLTYGRSGLFLVAPPERVAADVVRGLERGRRVVYSPRFWAPIMTAIRLLPTPLFERLRM
jgi:decaprenylphospho-beta-D-erythro-pentofuranosid-2-ulose 2-reductase